MLQLKRLKKKTVVSFREKEPFISKPLQKGLIYAFIFHLVLLSLFRVSLNLVSPQSYSTLPATVIVELAPTIASISSCPSFYTQKQTPILPTPSFSLPSPLEFNQTPSNSLFLTPMIETLEYEALEIDFDDDQD